MASLKTRYVCSKCNHIHIKWQGKCSNCGEFATINEEVVEELSKADIKNRQSTRSSFSKLSGKLNKLSEISKNDFNLESTKTGITGLDYLFSQKDDVACGLVKGSVTLIGGSPGIGKSTLLLQISDLFNQKENAKVIYVSGEESENQIALRAKRLGIKSDFYIANIPELEQILKIMDDEKPTFIVIDSIQALYSSQLSSISGSPSQIKECSSAIATKAKELNIDTFLIGHITKDGDIAGPEILKHIVDTVLYFDGDKESNFRILKVEKNRYGNTDESVLFEMKEDGLHEVEDPSSIFLENNFNEMDVGTVFLSTIYNNKGNLNKSNMNGSALIIEVQSLINSISSQYSTKVANGIEYNRLSILLGIIAKLTGITTNKFDIFINVVSGIKINDSASDLAVFLSLISSFKNEPMISDTAVFGEISLNGNLRLTKNYEKRIAVAEKIGFKQIILPEIKDDKMVKKLQKSYPKIKLLMAKNVYEANELAFNK